MFETDEIIYLKCNMLNKDFLVKQKYRLETFSTN